MQLVNWLPSTILERIEQFYRPRSFSLSPRPRGESRREGFNLSTAILIKARMRERLHSPVVKLDPRLDRE
jgi:hypothetical protein